MGTRKAKMVLLCEDSQHEAFARRFLLAMRWGAAVYVIKGRSSASALGCFVLLAHDEDVAGVWKRCGEGRLVGVRAPGCVRSASFGIVARGEGGIGAPRVFAPRLMGVGYVRSILGARGRALGNLIIGAGSVAVQMQDPVGWEAR